MPGNADTTIDQSAITVTGSSDPGEKDRTEQTRVDRFVVNAANATAWLFPLLIIIINTQVVIRKMGNNQAWLDDLQWWIYGFAMTVGFVYAITTQSHVRVDILHQNFSVKKKARIEIFGLGWMLLPFLAMMCDILFHYGWASVIAGEGSDSPNGLHKLYLLKMSLPIVFMLAIFATISMVSRHLSRIAPVRLWTILIAIFPAAWFLAERLSYYLVWWFLRITNSDLKPRQISKEPLLEPTMWYGLALVIIGIVFSLIFGRRKVQE